MNSIYFFRFLVVRLSIMLSLIFFACITDSCKHEKKVALAVIWNNNQPVAISIPMAHFHHAEESAIRKELQVKVRGMASPMMGDISMSDDEITFTPLVPLTR